MKKLLDAFLDLPTSQGILLLAGAVVLVAAIALVVEKIAYRRGWNHCRAHLEQQLQAHGAEQVSERI